MYRSDVWYYELIAHNNDNIYPAGVWKYYV